MTDVEQLAIHRAGHAVAHARLFGDGWRLRDTLSIERSGEMGGDNVAEEISQVRPGESLGDMFRDSEIDAI